MSEELYDSGEEEKEEEMKKAEMYKEIYQAKKFLKVFNRKKLYFNLKFPRNSFDRIIELYGEEDFHPLSFVFFSNPPLNVNIRTSMQINDILSKLNNYLIYPNSYENLNEIEKMRKAPKLKMKSLYSIGDKMGLPYKELIYYISFQMIEINIKKISRMKINSEIYSLIFNLIDLLGAKFGDIESFQIAFYSYRKILKLAGIELDKIIPYLDIYIAESANRQELNLHGKSILCNKARNRKLRDSIELNKRDQNMEIYNGIKRINKMKKPKEFKIFEFFREEASNLIKELNKDEKDEKIEKNNKNYEEEEQEENENKIYNYKKYKGDILNKKEINSVECENNENDNGKNEHNKEREIIEGENWVNLNNGNNTNDDNKNIENRQIIINGQNQGNNKENSNENNNENESIINGKNYFNANKNNEDIIENENLESKTFKNLIFNKKKEEKEKKESDNNSNDIFKNKKDIVRKMKLIIKAKKVGKTPYKIRRAVFIKVEKEK